MTISIMCIDVMTRTADWPLADSPYGALLDLRGRTAWVLGGSRGLGFACAEALLCCGARVVLIARKPELLERAAKELDFYRPTNGTTWFSCDLSREEERTALFESLTPPDILVANTGGPSFGRAESQTAKDWMTVFNDLFISQTEVIAGVLPTMRSRGWGRIVLLSSATLRNSNPELALSQVARSALAGYIAATSRDLVRQGITINALLAGSFATERTERYLRDIAQCEGMPPDEIQSRLTRSIPAGRLGYPKELGLLCAVLASEGGAFICGQQIVIDGGVTTVVCV